MAQAGRPTELIVVIDARVNRNGKCFRALLNLAEQFRAKLVDLPGVSAKVIAHEVRELGTAASLVVTTDVALARAIRRNARFDRHSPCRVVVIDPNLRPMRRAPRGIHIAPSTAQRLLHLDERYALRPWPQNSTLRSRLPADSPR